MNYRRSSQNHAGTDRWGNEHRVDLLRWLPNAVVESERSLNYVLLHGDDSLGTGWTPGWTPSWLPQQAAAAFLRGNSLSRRATVSFVSSAAAH